MIDNQQCRTCGKVKNLSEFLFRKDNQKYNTECKSCNKEYKKKWHQQNKDTNNIRSIQYYKDNKEIRVEKFKKYSISHKIEISLNKKEYRKNNKDHIKQYQKQYKEKEDPVVRNKRRRSWENKKIKTDPTFHLKKDVSRYINLALKAVDSSKLGKSITNYLDYSFIKLKDHLESKFESWMTWKNWGKYNSKIWKDDDSSTWTWQIDHIIPHSLFKYISMEDDNFKKCWSLNNLRPYSAKQNYLDGINRIRHI